MSHNEFSTKHECPVSHRPFWYGVRLYSAFFIAAATLIGGNIAESRGDNAQSANADGALIFADNALPAALPRIADSDFPGGWFPGNSTSVGQEADSIESISSFGRTLALQSPGSFTSVNLIRNQNLTVTGAPGATVVLSLTNFRMTGLSTFTLSGTATTSFVINVNNQFSLSGSAKIVLSGGVQWNNVVFNVRGKGGVVALSGRSSFTGILNAPERTVQLSDYAVVNGEVFAKKVILLESSQIIRPPVVSP